MSEASPPSLRSIRPNSPATGTGAAPIDPNRVAVDAPHAKTGEEIQSALTPLGFDFEKGLTAAKVEQLRARFGRNELPKGEQKHAILQFLEQFANPFVGALLAAAAVAIVIAIKNPAGGDDEHASLFARFGDAIAILLIVIANAVLGFVQERRAEKALDALQKMSAPLANVVRDGAMSQVPAAELVPG
ncbi:MAG: cation-transporting P-type ATPase, partial [Polyangiales bacterium]